MSESKKEYKERVLRAKDIVKEMVIKGQDMEKEPWEIKKDIDTFLKAQGLTSFELRANGDRKNTAYLQGLTHGFNTRLKEILQVVAPEIASTLDLKKFGMLNIDDILERDEKVKKATVDMIEQLFTTQLIPGQKPLIDQGFTPENLGERMADQAGETLIEFLPLMIAPNLIATQGPVQGFKMSYTMDPTKLQKTVDVLGNSIKTILNTYIKNPGKTFIADISASVGFGAGEQFGEELSGHAGEAESVGYYDVPSPLVQTLTGLTGAAGATAVAQTLMSPFKTKKALGTLFSSWLGIKPLLKKIPSWGKKKSEERIRVFFKDILKEHEKQIAEGQDLTKIVGDKLKLSTAEETLSPGVAAEQEAIEKTLVGKQVDEVVQRRVDNLKAMDETLSTIVPETDKNFQYFLDLRTGTIQPLIKKLEQQIAAGGEQLVITTEKVKPKLTKKESGENLRDIITTEQFNQSRDVVNELNAIKGGQLSADPEILDRLITLLAREFETGAEPAIISKLGKKINKYKDQEIQVPTGEKDAQGNAIMMTEIIPAEKQLTNQELFDIWLSASLEETALLGKVGIEKANKLTRLTEAKSMIMKQLMKNLENVKGSPQFFDKLNTYINNFEKGVVVRLRDNKPAGYQVKDELVADAFFQAENVDAMRDFIRVFSKDEAALYNMQQSILDRIANESINMETGLMNTDKYKIFLTKYKSALNELETIMPDFVNKLRETPSAVSAVAERLATLNTRKTFLLGEKLKNTLNVFGAETKQLKLGTVDEYVNAALADPKLMENLTQRIMKADAGEPWVKSVLEHLTKLRINPQKKTINPKEIVSMQKWITDNEKSLETLFTNMGPQYKDHLKNIKIIVNGFERVNFVTPPRGAPAPTPADQMRQTLGTDIPQFWSRIFAVASGRVGKNYMGMEIFNRFLNTVSKGHFDKIMKQAIYDPAFAKTLAGTVKGGKLSVGDLKEMYGFLAKLNGTIGVASEYGEDDPTIQDEARSKLFQMAPAPSVSFEQPPVVPESRMAQNPVGMIGTPTQPAQMASIYPQTMAGGQINQTTRDRGREVFGPFDRIFNAAQGGIMSTNKAFQRVA